MVQSSFIYLALRDFDTTSAAYSNETFVKYFEDVWVTDFDDELRMWEWNGEYFRATQDKYFQQQYKPSETVNPGTVSNHTGTLGHWENIKLSNTL